MTDKEVMQMALDALSESKRSHYYCEDRFYSCPKHEEGCANDFDGDECNCGADTVNKSIDAAIEALRAALAQPDVPETAFGETEPVAWVSHNAGLYHGKPDESLNPLPLYLAPPRREWVGLTDDDINDLWRTAMWNTEGTRLPIPEFARAIEAKLKEKNS